MDHILIGHCKLCNAPVYETTDGKKPIFSCSCGHEGVSRFCSEMNGMISQEDLLNESTG